MKINNNCQNICPCDEEKDLGVHFDGSLSFDIHIDKVVSKANQMTGIIRRTFSFLDKSTFLQLYKSMIRPHVEYANIVWFPYLKRQSVTVEKVQRRATKLIPGCSGMSYDQRLKFLKLHSLKGRRIRGDLIEAFKIFNGFTDLAVDGVFLLSDFDKTRSCERKIRVQHSNTSRRRSAYSYRIANYWNSLPTNIKFAKDTNTFKNLIDNNPKFHKIFSEYD